MTSLRDVLLAERSKKRGDEAAAHVSDLVACDRATWYRRHGYTPQPFTREKLAQFAIGLGYEQEVVAKLRAHFEPLLVPVYTEIVQDDDGFVGHPDFIIGERAFGTWADDAIVGEVKTTDAKAPDKELAGAVPPMYAVQAAAYALREGIARCIVLVKHAISHDEFEYPFMAATYRPLIESRKREVPALTGPDAETPPIAKPNPLMPYQCKGCNWRQCLSNPHYDPNGGFTA